MPAVVPQGGYGEGKVYEDLTPTLGRLSKHSEITTRK